MGVSERHFRRLLKRFRRHGRSGLVSRRRGAPSNHRLPDATRRRALELIRERYADFGPTFAHEKLMALHRDKFDRSFSVETLRR